MEVSYMTNYTTETYQVKRNILNFSNKITIDTRKSSKKLCQDMCYGILSGKSCYLSEIARQLKEEIKLNNTIDRLSNNLSILDKEEIAKIKENYFKEVMKYLPEDYVIVLNDDTDLNKEYSRKLENLCVIRDASSQTEKYVNGYKVCEYTALSKNSKTPISLYSKIYSTESPNFISENNETIKGEDEVIRILKIANRKPIFVRDRGYDANEYLVRDIKSDNKFVTRLKGNRNLIFKNKLRNVEEVAKERKGKIVTNLIYHGENRECAVSYTRVKLPAYKTKDVSLVTIHGLSNDNIPMMLLTNLEVKDKESSEYVVRLYFLRWRIEEYFKAKKSYNWENSLLRTLDSMNNLNLFLTISMFYLTTIIEKMNTNFLSNVILERAQLLREKLLVYLSAVSTGIVEILKYARTGIKEWQNIEQREKYRQLSLII
jgi:hypothetical protein